MPCAILCLLNTFLHGQFRILYALRVLLKLEVCIVFFKNTVLVSLTVRYHCKTQLSNLENMLRICKSNDDGV